MQGTEKQWVVGSAGVSVGSPGGEWSRLGSFDYNTNAVMRSAAGLIAGVNCGVWRVDTESGSWTQLHDETVTEVLAIAPHPSAAGVVVGTPYGIASAGPIGPDGSFRWRFHSDTLLVNQRFTTALLRLPDDAGGTGDGAAAAGQKGTADYLVGTEGGLLVARGVPSPTAGWETPRKRTDEVRWEITSVPSVPVRAVIRAGDTFFAGTDGRGVWSSTDGVRWAPAGRGAESATVLSLATDGERILCGTDRGVLVGDGDGAWSRRGPGVLVTAIASARPGTWLVGAKPTGLWWTETAGRRFEQLPGFSAVGVLLAPNGEES